MALLASLAAVSLLSGDGRAALIISGMILFSVGLRFSQEYRSVRAAEGLRRMVHTTATVKRRDARRDISPGLAADLGLQLDAGGPLQEEVPIDRLVPGDVVLLAAGDMIPADVRVLTSKDLFVSQAALTGESLPAEKHVLLPPEQRQGGEPLELVNLCFLGTNVISGTATAVVIGLALPFTPIGAAIDLVPLPMPYFAWLAVILLGYITLTQLVKSWFVRRFGYG